MLAKTKYNGFALAVLLVQGTMGYAEEIQSKEVLKTTKSWNDASLPSFSPGKTEFNIDTYKVPTHTKTAVHLHPMNGAGYILSGELTMYSTNDPHGSFANQANVKKVVLKAGQAWAETVNTWHYGENNTDKEVELVLFFAGAKNTPPSLSLPVNG